MKRLVWVAALAAVTLTALLLWPAKHTVLPFPGAQTTKQEPTPAPKPAPPSSHAPSLKLAVELNAQGSDGSQDVIVLHRILMQYQHALGNRQGTPIGNDTDLARALMGHNPMKQFFLPPGHPALSANGHLVDRWGTPYFLHPRGNGAFEVRSAGPDRRLFTEDDLVANPVPAGQ